MTGLPVTKTWPVTPCRAHTLPERCGARHRPRTRRNVRVSGSKMTRCGRRNPCRSVRSESKELSEDWNPRCGPIPAAMRCRVSMYGTGFIKPADDCSDIRIKKGTGPEARFKSLVRYRVASMRREKRNSRPSSSIKKASGGTRARSRLWLMPRKGARGRGPPCTGSTPPAPFNKRLKQPRRGEDFAPALGGLEVYVNQLGGHERTNAFLQRFEPEGQEARKRTARRAGCCCRTERNRVRCPCCAGEEPRGGRRVTHGLFHGVQPRS